MNCQHGGEERRERRADEVKEPLETCFDWGLAWPAEPRGARSEGTGGQGRSEAQIRRTPDRVAPNAVN